MHSFIEYFNKHLQPIEAGPGTKLLGVEQWEVENLVFTIYCTHTNYHPVPLDIIFAHTDVERSLTKYEAQR